MNANVKEPKKIELPIYLGLCDRCFYQKVDHRDVVHLQWTNEPRVCACCHEGTSRLITGYYTNRGYKSIDPIIASIKPSERG